MQRLLAIDCDPRELCFVLASVSGERITLETCATVPVKLGADDVALTPDELGKQLQATLAKAKRSGAKCVALVDRNSIELSEITVPPATDAELPELVLNQLAIQSPNIADESIVDFIPSPGEANESRRVTAAALTKAEKSRVTTACTVAGVNPDRLLVRPYETAALFLSQRPNRSGDSLLVNIIADEVDLVVVDQTRALFFRTVRLPAKLGDEATEQRLLDEIRRTLLIAPQNAAVGQVIQSVVIIGAGLDHERIVQQLSKDCAANVELFDPFDGFATASEWEAQTSGRSVPLLGALVTEARANPHALDFLHPRRAPTPPNRRRQLIVGLIAVTILAGVAGYFISEPFKEADEEIKKLKEELADQTARIKKTAEKRKIADALEEWNANSVVWLDELRDLSAEFPSGQDILIQRLSMSPSRGGKASITFPGLARESKVVPRMESSLRDERHEIQTSRIEERAHDKQYGWSFESAITFTPEKLELEEPAEEEPAPDETKRSKKKKRE